MQRIDAQGYRPLYLRLVGFRGVRSGLGRDSLELDLATPGQDVALVAIAGANGRGKTTVMDNLHPYLVLPSRASSEGGFSYYDHVYLPQSEKELVWSHNGHTYRSHVVIRVNGRRRTEAYLLEQDAQGNWHPARTDDGTASDGKVETYERLVRSILGPSETFFTSVFSAQGKRSLSAYRNSEIKTLLGDLLGLEAIREQGVRAGEVARALKTGLAVLRQEREQIGLVRQGLERDAKAVTATAVPVKDAAQRRDDSAAAVRQAQEALATAKAQEQAAKVHEQRRAELQAQLANVRRSADEATARHRSDIAALDIREKAIRARCMDRQRQAEQRRNVLQRQLDAAQVSLEGEAAVSRAVRRLALARRVVTERRARLDQARQANERMGEIGAVGSRIRDEVQAVEREAGQVSLRQQDLVRRLQLVDQVPCAGTDLQGQCRLLGDAHEARQLRPSVDLKIAALATRREELRTALAALRQQALVLVDAPTNYAVAQIREQRSTARARNYELAAAREGELRQAREIAAAVAQELHAMSSQVLGPTTEELGEIEAVAAERKAKIEQFGKAAEDYAAQMRQLGEAIARVPQPDCNAARIASETLVRAEGALEAAEQAYAASLRSEEAIRALDHRMTQAAAQEAAVAARAASAEAELGYWNLLAKALSNDGVIALEIDDAGPTLASLANDLLLASYGPRFSVEIRTQTLTTKGEQRETFDIVVHDGLREEAKSLHLVSGGERVWINECLTRAIALYLTQNTGRHFGTLFCDEADGPLDPAHKRMFMDMKREVLRLGGYEREYFVSQAPELTEMADVVIDLDALALSQAEVVK